MKRFAAMLGILLLTQSAAADSYEEHDYILNCSGCHRMDGSGSRTVPPLHAMPDLGGRPGAREYWIRVPGAAQAPLSDARLAALMNWLVERFTGETVAPAYTAEEVGRLRRAPLRDPIERRKAILQLPSR